MGALGKLARRFVAMMSGEVLQSAFHFGFNVALLRTLPALDYGVFAIVFLIGGLALTYMRALCGMLASLYIPLRPDAKAADAYDVTFGSAAAACATVIGGGTAAWLFLWLGREGIGAGCFVGLWSLRSYLRVALYARRQVLVAALSDIVFTGSGVLLSLFLLGRPASDGLLQASFLVLAGANAAAIVAALILPRRRVRLSFGRATRRRYRVLWRQLAWSCVGVTTANIQAQGQVLLIAAIAGPAAYAPIAAMLVFFAPLRLAAAALANMMQPELAHRVGQGAWPEIRRLLTSWSAAMGAIGVLTGLGIGVTLPWMHWPVFEGQPKTLIGALVWSTAVLSVLYVMPKVLLEVVRAFRLIAVMAGLSAATGMVIAALLLWRGSVAWSLIGSVVSEAIVLAWCWTAVARLPGSLPFGRGDPTRTTERAAPRLDLAMRCSPGDEGMSRHRPLAGPA